MMVLGSTKRSAFLILKLQFQKCIKSLYGAKRTCAEVERFQKSLTTSRPTNEYTIHHLTLQHAHLARTSTPPRADRAPQRQIFPAMVQRATELEGPARSDTTASRSKFVIHKSTLQCDSLAPGAHEAHSERHPQREKTFKKQTSTHHTWTQSGQAKNLAMTTKLHTRRHRERQRLAATVHLSSSRSTPVDSVSLN